MEMKTAKKKKLRQTYMKGQIIGEEGNGGRIHSA